MDKTVPVKDWNKWKKIRAKEKCLIGAIKAGCLHKYRRKTYYDYHEEGDFDSHEK